jgi:hypothetical protein
MRVELQFNNKGMVHSWAMLPLGNGLISQDRWRTGIAVKGGHESGLVFE